MPKTEDKADNGITMLCIGEEWEITTKGLVRMTDGRLFSPHDLRALLKGEFSIIALLRASPDPELCAAALLAGAAAHECRVWRQTMGTLVREMVSELREREARRRDEELLAAIDDPGGRSE
jgi:hypothetical protein